MFVGLAVVSYLMILAWNEGLRTTTCPNIFICHQPDHHCAGRTITLKRHPKSFPLPNRAARINPLYKQHLRTSATVVTDTYNIQINRVGGNISSSALLQYKLSLGNDEPLPLLENGPQRIYHLESGFYGKNGFDSLANKGPVHYQSSSSEYVLAEGDSSLVIDLSFQTEEGLNVIKRYTFERDSYLIKLDFCWRTKVRSVAGQFLGKIIRDGSADPSQQNSMGMKSF